VEEEIEELNNLARKQRIKLGVSNSVLHPTIPPNFYTLYKLLNINKIHAFLYEFAAELWGGVRNY